MENFIPKEKLTAGISRDRDSEDRDMDTEAWANRNSLDINIGDAAQWTEALELLSPSPKVQDYCWGGESIQQYRIIVRP